ncbi:MFS transporter [bacterium]|nr:MFS transporter [bacterium]
MLAPMAVATAVASSLGIVATYLIDDLHISRSQMGALIGATQLVAALASPGVGGFADRIGGRRALLVLFLLSAGGFLGMAVSPVFWVMFVPPAVAAVGASSGVVGHQPSVDGGGPMTDNRRLMTDDLSPRLPSGAWRHLRS